MVERGVWSGEGWEGLLEVSPGEELSSLVVLLGCSGSVVMVSFSCVVSSVSVGLVRGLFSSCVVSVVSVVSTGSTREISSSSVLSIGSAGSPAFYVSSSWSLSLAWSSKSVVSGSGDLLLSFLPRAGKLLKVS